LYESNDKYSQYSSDKSGKSNKLQKEALSIRSFKVFRSPKDHCQQLSDDHDIQLKKAFVSGYCKKTGERFFIFVVTK
jgi:hypothetical protein